MVAEQHPAVGGDEVLAVVQGLGRGGAVIARSDQLALNQLGVEAVADQVGADGRDDKPDGIDMFPAQQGDHGPGEGAQQCHQQQDHAGGG
ncbi:Uncharacterised protein [Mycobacteroides abscessus]|nr:Uncharacterised protein [Mycobacteroides abscessus]